MEFLKRFLLEACIVWMAFAALPGGSVARAFDRPAVAERNSPTPPSDPVRRYGDFAFRQWATSLAYSPDGRWLAAGDQKGVTIFDAKTGEILVKHSFHLNLLAGLAFSPDGESLTIVDPRGLMICGVREGAVPERVPVKDNAKLGRVKLSATSPDRKWRATMPYNQELGIGPWDQGEPLHKIPFKCTIPYLVRGKLAMANEGQWVATVQTKSPVVQIWKAPKYDSPDEWKVGNALVTDMAAAPDGETLYAATSDGSIQAWNVKQAREIVKIRPVRQTRISALALSEKGTYLAAATNNGVMIYETKTGRRVQSVGRGNPGPLVGLAFSPDESTLAIGPYEQPLELWSVKTGKAIYLPTMPAIKTVFATKDPRRFGSHDAEKPELYSSTNDFTITFWNRETGRPEENIPLNPWANLNPHQSTKLLSDGAEQIIIKLADWEVFYRNLALGQKKLQSLGRMPYGRAYSVYHGQALQVQYLGPGVFQLRGLPFPTRPIQPRPQAAPNPARRPLNRVVLNRPKELLWDLKAPAVPDLAWTASQNGQTLAALFADRSVLVWEIKTGNLLQKLQFEQTPRRILLNPDGQTLAVAFDESLTLWDLKTGKQSQEFQLPKSQSRLLAFGTQSKILAVATPDERFRLFGLESGKEILTLPAPDFPAGAMAFSPDDKWLAVGYQDKTIGLFDLDKKQEVRIFEGHTAPVTALSFDPEGTMLLSGSQGPEVMTWDVATGKHLSTKKLFNNRVSQVSWTAEGDQAIVVQDDDFVWFPAPDDSSKMSTGGGPMSLALEDFAYCPETETLAVGTNKGIRILENYGRELPFLREDNVRHVEWAAEGRILMAASADLFGFDVEQEKEVYRIPAAKLNGAITAMERSPDGRMVATGHSNRSVGLWDPKTGQLIRTLNLPGESSIESLQFSADGRLVFAFSRQSYVVFEVESGLVWFHKPNDPHEPDVALCVMEPGIFLSAESQGTARLWSWVPDLKSSQETPTEDLWEALAGNDGTTVCRSMFALADRGDDTVAFLTGRLPLAPASPKKIASLIEDLNHEIPAQRRKASEELRRLGAEARPHLEEALKKEDLSPRDRSRIRFLLKAQPAGASPELLSIRAVQLLEWIATPKARALLKEWAKKPEEPLGRDAQAALDRLSPSKR